jgi:hypothetical protein
MFGPLAGGPLGLHQPGLTNLEKDQTWLRLREVRLKTI